MIDYYYAPTPNTRKVSIMLEECELPYRVIPMDLLSGDQHKPEFLAVNPNGRIPAIVDHEGPEGSQPVFESGAILLYLAEKTGRFLAPHGRARVEAFAWLMWQMGGLGPMAGQVHHFLRSAPPGNEYAAERYLKETARLYGVLDSRLSSHEWLAGEAYGIADMASWGWVSSHTTHEQDLKDFPSVARWFSAINARPAAQRARAARVTGPYYDTSSPDQS
jgi:GSH-dependent disulfide-bond oxidoreductase